jgi:hypothetical protein|tara:strand:- start:34528 stop:34896 length:369 start_codon:yes stop_codon:yes gene_type:complete
MMPSGKAIKIQQSYMSKIEFTLYDDFTRLSITLLYRDNFMKKLISLCILFIAIGISLLSCGSKLTTHIDFNQETNFQSFSSYQFSTKVNNSLDANPIMINRIQGAVEVALAGKGLKSVPLST